MLVAKAGFEPARERLISLAPDERPDERDPLEPAPVGDDTVVAQFSRSGMTDLCLGAIGAGADCRRPLGTPG